MTDRTLDADLEAGARSSVFGYVVMVKLAFPSGTAFLHNGVGTILYGGDEYLGVGTFGGISGIEETTDLISRPVRLTLSSVNDEIIAAIRADDIFGRDADIYLARIDDGVMVGTPTNWYSGHMEMSELILGSKDSVQITVQSRASRLKLRNNKRYTLEEHQRQYEGDLFFEFLPYVQEAEVVWGGAHVRTGFQNTEGFTGSSSGAGRNREIGQRK